MEASVPDTMAIHLDDKTRGEYNRSIYCSNFQGSKNFFKENKIVFGSYPSVKDLQREYKQLRAVGKRHFTPEREWLRCTNSGGYRLVDDLPVQFAAAPQPTVTDHKSDNTESIVAARQHPYGICHRIECRLGVGSSMSYGYTSVVVSARKPEPKDIDVVRAKLLSEGKRLGWNKCLLTRLDCETGDVIE